ncbi:MAG: DUF4835 family protein [Bacteroidales bacterium]|nr:DUF4835 family protein [Bacteroidales bacterium]
MMGKLAWSALIAAGISTSASNIKAQELNAKVIINTEQIEASFRERFTTLQQDLQEFINDKEWTMSHFAVQERINCTFAFTISDMPASDTYNASLTIQANRPVYYSTYQTTTFNWRDEQVSFSYTEGQTLTFNEFNLDNELLNTTVFYIYLILGCDYDSFSPLGGNEFFQKAESMVNSLQSSDSKGWRSFENKKNRHALISAWTDQRQTDYRQMWYDYHRSGLDIMHQSMDKGRRFISNSLQLLKKVREADAQSPLLSLFIASKLDELCNIYSEAPMQEKQQAYKLLQELFPTEASQFESIKQKYKE